jgi:hypothetical protein
LDSPFPGLALKKQLQTRFAKHAANLFAVKMKRTKILFQVLVISCICCEYLDTFVIAAAANTAVTWFLLDCSLSHSLPFAGEGSAASDDDSGNEWEYKADKSVRSPFHAIMIIWFYSNQIIPPRCRFE